VNANISSEQPVVNHIRALQNCNETGYTLVCCDRWSVRFYTYTTLDNDSTLASRITTMRHVNTPQ